MEWIIGGIAISIIIVMGGFQIYHNLKHPSHFKNSNNKNDSTNSKTSGI